MKTFTEAEEMVLLECKSTWLTTINHTMIKPGRRNGLGDLRSWFCPCAL